MDLPLDPPQHFLSQPPVALPYTTTPVANPTPTLPPVHNHPPYSEMIAAAITDLNERDGSSKQAIAKYIETQYTGLPPIHSALLTHHIKRLKNSGHLVMLKNSYKLPGSVPVTATNGAVNAVSSDPASTGPTKRRGRPPKPKPELLQASAVAVPVFEPPAVGPLVNGPAPTGTGSGRGRPPKRVPGRPPKTGGAPPVAGGGSSVTVGKGRGRPRKIATTDAAAPAAPVKRSGRPRGRPRKFGYVNEGVGGAVTGVAPPVAVGGGGAAVVGGKRRGRPPKAFGETVLPRKARKLSGKPVGRPRKSELPAPAQHPDSLLLVAYLDLKTKYDNLQSRVKQAANVIKPYLNNEGAFTALQELELLAEVDINAPSNVQVHQQPAQPASAAGPTTSISDNASVPEFMSISSQPLLQAQPLQSVIMPQFQS